MKHCISGPAVRRASRSIQTSLQISPLLIALFAVTFSVRAAADPVPFERIAGGTYAPPVATGGLETNRAYGTSRSAPLGNVAERYDFVLDLRQQPYPYKGTFKWTTTDGNEIHGVYEGVTSASDQAGFSEFSGPFTITGGTGRFRGASGSGTFSGLANFNVLETGVWIGFTQGTLTLPEPAAASPRF